MLDDKMLPPLNSVAPSGAVDAAVKTVTLHAFPDPELEKAWRSFLLSADYPTHYVSPEFFREPFFSAKQQFAIVATIGTAVVAVLTGIHDDGRIICGVAGRPQVAFGPGTGPDVQSSLIKAVLEEGARSSLITITTWSVIPGFLQEGFEQTKVDSIMTLDLTLGPAALFKQFNKGRRSDIAFAARNGVEVREAASEEDLRAYYDIYSGWCARKQIEVASYETMRDAMSLRSNRRLFMAFHESKAIAGSVVRFVPSGVAEYSANNSLESALPLRPNSLLNWVAIQWACAEGLRMYSMGGSHPFLRHFGGLEIPIYRYRIDLTTFKIHDRRDWAAAKIRSIARVVRNRLKRSGRSK